MTRQPHDQLAKEYLEELLAPLGEVKTSKDVKSEVQEIDVWFVPTTTVINSELGLLGKMAVTSCLFEPYRNAPNEIEIRSCLLKLYSVQGELLRQAKREKRSISEEELPFLWILTPTCSERILEGFGAKTKEGWEKGVYFLPKYQKAAIVAINQLPIIEDTLWLRAMGKGKTQTEAISKVVELSRENDKLNKLVAIFASWQKNLELNSDVNDEEVRELIMSLSPAYLKQCEEWKQEGIEEGRQEGRQEGQQDGQRLMVESLLAVRFGNLDEELSTIVIPMMELSLTERTQLLLNLSNLSREELLARFKVD
ncbi:MAG: hypothetical protein HEQ29_04665 [Dolichospermum sp. LBC05a]|jgi:hypothetical protein|nr:hypothetical protein [Dolichospermum sp. DET73]MBS9392456.1 hypothetical protein [Dolichospermum sp. OL01]MCO5796099.1 hypothetical protein [Dolichospermum sp. OL03]MCS6282601.1 hypothetical protein [Dolichospermum sp.]QSV57740.1 MAG: hypothetical protein HEQ29_04665 [Dolichospermum sp. LBC05a]